MQTVMKTADLTKDTKSKFKVMPLETADRNTGYKHKRQNRMRSWLEIMTVKPWCPTSSRELIKRGGTPESDQDAGKYHHDIIPTAWIYHHFMLPDQTLVDLKTRLICAWTAYWTSRGMCCISQYVCHLVIPVLYLTFSLYSAREDMIDRNALFHMIHRAMIRYFLRFRCLAKAMTLNCINPHRYVHTFSISCCHNPSEAKHAVSDHWVAFV